MCGSTTRVLIVRLVRSVVVQKDMYRLVAGDLNRLSGEQLKLSAAMATPMPVLSVTPLSL